MTSALALPLIVAALGFWFQLTMSKREARRQAAENERSEKAEAWRLMLPISHEYAVKYYTELDLGAKKLLAGIADVRSIRPDTPPEKGAAIREQALQAWIGFHLSMRAIQETGAFYFKNPIGELLVSSLYRAYFNRFVCNRPEGGGPSAWAGDEELRVKQRLAFALDSFATTDSHHTIAQKLAQNPALAATYSELMEWLERRLKDAAAATTTITYLSAFQAVLFFEMNRPYSVWYGRETRLKLTNETIAAIKKLCEEAGKTDEQMREVGDGLRAYLMKSGIGEDQIRRAWPEPPGRA